MCVCFEDQHKPQEQDLVGNIKLLKTNFFVPHFKLTSVAFGVMLLWRGHLFVTAVM